MYNRGTQGKEKEKKMGLTGGPGSRKIYNDELLFKTYFGWGAAATFEKLREFCKRTGQISVKTGRPSHMGPIWAVWRYAFNNPESIVPGTGKTTYEMYREWWYDTDAEKKTPTFMHFILNIQTHTYNKKSICGHEKYLEFCERYGLNTVPDEVRMGREFEGNTVLPVDKLDLEKIAQEVGAMNLHEEIRQNQEVSVEAGNAVG